MAEGDNIDNKDLIEEDLEGNENWRDFAWAEKLEKNIEAWRTQKEAKNLGETIVDRELDNLHNKIELWLEKANVKDITKNELNDFFSEWKEKLNDDKHTFREWRLKRLLKSDRFKKRSEHVVERIEESASTVENEIKNWQKEKNPVARSLLRIVNWIMWTEK